MRDRFTIMQGQEFVEVDSVALAGVSAYPSMDSSEMVAEGMRKMSNEKHGAGGSVEYGCVIKLITPITTLRASTWTATIDEKREPEFAEKIRSLPVGGKWKNWWKHPDNIMRLFPPNAKVRDGETGPHATKETDE